MIHRLPVREESPATFTTTVELVTPAIAESYLRRNRDNNRPISFRTMAEYQQAMERGEWQLTPQGIIFDVHGTLIDGQHRLSAVVRSGCSVWMAVTRGADTANFKAIDVGHKRTPGHIMAMLGEPNGNLLAAALNWMLRYEAGTIDTRSLLKPSSDQLSALLDRHPAIRDHLGAHSRMRPSRLLPPSLAAWLEYEFHRIDRAAATAFVQAFGQGEGLRPGTAELALRRRLDDNLASQARLRPEALAAFVIKGWNAIQRGHKASLIKRVQGEPFPVIHGRP